MPLAHPSATSSTVLGWRVSVRSGFVEGIPVWGNKTVEDNLLWHDTTMKCGPKDAILDLSGRLRYGIFIMAGIHEVVRR